jgi:uncharacterized protein YqhQ
MNRKDSPVNTEEKQTSENKTKKISIIKWIKKLGFIGFLFFLIKGLLWLIIPWVIANFFL